MTNFNDGKKTTFMKLLSIRAERNSDDNSVIDFLIYSDVADFYRNSIRDDESRKDITNIEGEIVYRGVTVKANLKGYVENDINKAELCLHGKLKLTFEGLPVKIDLDKDCDSY
ncbi:MULTISPECIES: hypothetical protein [Bacillus]|uniref:hypothetical protein n=1 Tax=Bacillus TaxID=1386 RepID=UPI000468B763|nr:MULTISPECIES: hypothetical protein [Bacillus]PEW91897.1 hypothetical protein CN447_12725 [Bacillus thuringiensis]